MNAHSTKFYATSAWSPPSSSGITQADLDDSTRGIGWGSSDVNLQNLFDPQRAASIGSFLQNGIRELENGVITGGATIDGNRQPYIGAVYGRYGSNEQPGAYPTFDDFLTPPYEDLLYGPSTLGVDLKSLSKLVIDSSGKARYVFPAGSAPSTISTVPEFFKYQFWESPYAARLDAASSRENSRKSLANNSIFSLSELERVLRFYDKDANALPQRLAALLGSEVPRARQLITTDSWDTPALTGDVADRILNYFSGLSPAIVRDILSSDLYAGIRFDVNRPVDTLPQKRLYCQDLFVLMVALGALPDADLAQWVVNVMDYRDADSNMTDFEWDDDLSNGWNPEQNEDAPKPDPADPTSRNPVYGVEKPDLVIAQTVATNKNGTPPEGELFVVLYRPPGETIDLPNDSIDYAPVDPDLAGEGENVGKLDLSKKVGNSFVWRLHYYELSDQNDPTSIKTSTSKYILPSQVANLPANGGTPFDQDNTTATLNPIGDGQYVDGGEYILIGPPLPGEGTFSLTSNSNAIVKQIQLEYGADLRFKDGDTSESNGSGPNSAKYAVTLERLRDPALAYNANTNPYVAIDSVRAKPNNPNSTLKSFFRGDDFWQTPGQETIKKNGSTTKLPADELLNQVNRDALNWANRPFISQVEIALVPPGSGVNLLQQIRLPAATDEYFYLASSSDSSQIKKAFNPGPGRTKFEIAKDLLAATQVLSRATSGNRTIYVGMNFSQQDRESLGLFRSGIDVFPTDAPQILGHRVPGRVNLNLMPIEDEKISATSTNYATQRGWRAVVGDRVTDSLFPNPPRSTTPPKSDGNTSPFSANAVAKSPSDLLGLGTPGQLFRDTNSQANRHPLLAYKTAIKLANVGTIRSNVFAVWITLRVTNTQTQASTSHRLFAIVDRSIPVAFAPGQNLNSANTIRLKRYLD